MPLRRKRSTSPRLRSFGIPLAGAGILVGAALLIRTLFTNTAYTVSRVIDGDTFETTEKQLIRINGIQAPEKNLCGWEESTETLKRIIAQKQVYIKVVYLDTYRRMIADVYLPDGSNLAEMLAKEGSVFVLQKSGSNPALLTAGGEARDHQRGIFGPPCTTETNTDKPSCSIKANRKADGTAGIYHYEGCREYTTTIVQKYLGDEWFCIQAEAVKAGYTKSKNCY